MKAYRNASEFDRHLHHFKVVHAREGKFHCEMPVLEEHLNMRGFLHGGFTALLIDNMCTTALITCDRGVFGQTTDLNISYLSSARPGDTLTLKADVMKQGTRLGFIQVSVENQHGVMVASGRQTMFMSR